MRTTEKSRARRLIFSALDDDGIRDNVIKKVLCALFGHPPVVQKFFGYVHCSRCAAQIGDQLGGCFPTEEGKVAVQGHDCDGCRAVWKGMTPAQRLLTSNPFTSSTPEAS